VSSSTSTSKVNCWQKREVHIRTQKRERNGHDMSIRLSETVRSIIHASLCWGLGFSDTVLWRHQRIRRDCNPSKTGPQCQRRLLWKSADARPSTRRLWASCRSQQKRKRIPAGSLRNRSHNSGITSHVRSKLTAPHTSGVRLHQTLHVECLRAISLNAPCKKACCNQPATGTQATSRNLNQW